MTFGDGELLDLAIRDIHRLESALEDLRAEGLGAIAEKRSLDQDLIVERLARAWAAWRQIRDALTAADADLRLRIHRPRPERRQRQI